MKWIYPIILILIFYLSERMSLKIQGQKGGGGGIILIVLILLTAGGGIGYLVYNHYNNTSPSHSPGSTQSLVTSTLNPGTCGANFDCSGETTNTQAKPSGTVTADTPGTAAECCEPELSCDAGYAINSSGTECVVNTGPGQCIANTEYQTQGLWANVRCPAIKNRNDCVGDESKQSKLHTIYTSKWDSDIINDLQEFNLGRGLELVLEPLNGGGNTRTMSDLDYNWKYWADKGDCDGSSDGGLNCSATYTPNGELPMDDCLPKDCISESDGTASSDCTSSYDSTIANVCARAGPGKSLGAPDKNDLSAQATEAGVTAEAISVAMGSSSDSVAIATLRALIKNKNDPTYIATLHGHAGQLGVSLSDRNTAVYGNPEGTYDSSPPPS